MARAVTVLVAAVAVAAALAGCGASGGVQRVPSAAAPARPPSPTPATPGPVPIAVPSASGFPTDYAVPCAGRPDLGQVVALLRAKKVLPATATATATSGPLCSGTWQYTALNVDGLGLLQVMTRGEPATLELVTAGTDVCGTAGIGQAPPGILAITRC